MSMREHSSRLSGHHSAIVDDSTVYRHHAHIAVNDYVDTYLCEIK